MPRLGVCRLAASLPLARGSQNPAGRKAAHLCPLLSSGATALPLPWGELRQPPKQLGPGELAEVTLTLYTHVYNQGQMAQRWIRFNATPVRERGGQALHAAHATATPPPVASRNPLLI